MKVYADNAHTVLTEPRKLGNKENRAGAAVILDRGTNSSRLNDLDPADTPREQYTSELVGTPDEEVQIHFMFGSSVHINHIQFIAKEAGKFPSNFALYAYTTDGWKEVLNITNYTYPAGAKTHNFSFEGVDCSSFMLVASGLYEIEGQYGMQLNEIRLYGSFEDGSCTVLADGNNDNKLSEQEDGDALRTHLVSGVTVDSKYDLNMDKANSATDLIRLKRYFAQK